MKNIVYQQFLSSRKDTSKQFAVLIDPDDIRLPALKSLIRIAVNAGVDHFFVGGSLMLGNTLDDYVKEIKDTCAIPVTLFPGSIRQISDEADAIFYLSVISGRNPDLLIGQHVIAAPALRASSLEILPTGYILIDGGVPTTVSYMSNTQPIPRDKHEIACCTAMAGEMLGLRLIYLDAGSGAKQAIPMSIIEAVSSHIDIPLIVGGGIRTPEAAVKACKAGADIIVVGDAIEKDASLASEISIAIHSLKSIKQEID